MNNYKKLGNIKGKLVHIELGIEYYENDSLINPTKEQKLLWEIYGLPKNIEKIEQSSETTIDEVFGKNKKEIQDKINEKIKNGEYSYLGESPKLNLVFSEKMAKGGGVGKQIAKMGTTVITKEYIDRFDMLSSAYNMSDINYYMFRGELKKPIEEVERDIAKAKKEIEIVNKRLPFTTWELKLKKGQNKFDFLGDTYEIYSEKKPMESYGWRNRGWEKAYYGIRKITNNSEKDYFTQLPYHEKKEELISMLNWKFIKSMYKQESDFPLPENDSFKGGGKIKRSKESIIADSRYKALPEGSRKSKKYATIELADGTKIRRRNANQTGDVEGGRYYSEKRPNHTDKSGKVVVSVRTKGTKKVVKTSASVLKPSDSIKFVGINFKKYNYTVGGL